jgi:hypothetical protein
MPAPTAHLIPTQYTSETAVEAGRLSGIAKRERAKEYRQAMAMLRQVDIIPKAVLRQIRLTNEQIRRARTLLTNEECPHCKRSPLPGKEIASIMRELRGFLEHELRLRGIGEPARSRPTNEPGSRAPMRQIVARVVPETAPLASDVSSSTQEPKPQG